MKRTAVTRIHLQINFNSHNLSSSHRKDVDSATGMWNTNAKATHSGEPDKVVVVTHQDIGTSG